MVTPEIIMSTAMRLFLQHGVKTVTIDRIVKELYTSKRTIYSHFKDKTALLKACLLSYHQRIRQENEEMIRMSQNAIEAFGYLHQAIVKRAGQVNPNFFNDILHYYPGLLHESYRNSGNFAHQQLEQLAHWGMEDGIFLEDLDVPVISKTVLELLKMLKNTDLFPVTKYSKERLTFGILVPYMRGLCTSKGIKLLEKQKELFQVAL